MPISRKQILIVDDDPDSCEMLAVFLTANDFDVATAHTVNAGLALARQNRFDLHVVDWYFPHGSGAALCQQLRELNAVTPVVVWSSDAREETQQQARGVGAAAFFTKPVDLDQIVAAIHDLIRSGQKETTNDVADTTFDVFWRRTYGLAGS